MEFRFSALAHPCVLLRSIRRRHSMNIYKLNENIAFIGSFSVYFPRFFPKPKEKLQLESVDCEKNTKNTVKMRESQKSKWKGNKSQHSAKLKDNTEFSSAHHQRCVLSQREKQRRNTILGRKTANLQWKVQIFSFSLCWYTIHLRHFGRWL